MLATVENTAFSIPSGTMVGDDILDLLGSSVIKSEHRERFALSSAADVWNEHEPIDYLIDELIPRASVNQFVGDAGSKKTWALLDMAVCVATGEKWLDFQTKQASVLWIDEENGQRRMKRRLYMTLNGHLVPKGTEVPIYFTCLNGANFRDITNTKNDVADLQALIEQTGAGLVVIDPQVSVTGGAKENSAEEMQPFFNNLKQVADATQAAIVVIHHNSKAGDYRGSTAIKGAVDVMIGVESKPESDFITFENKKVRDNKLSSFSARATWQAEKEQFSLSPSDMKDATNSVKMGKPMRYVLRYLLEHGSSPLKEVCENADTCAPASARTALYELAEKGYAKRTNAGEQLLATYELTGMGRDLAEKS